MQRLMKAQRRIKATLSIAAIVFIGIGSGVYVGVSRTLDDARWVAHTQEVIVEINRTQVELLSAMAAARAYMINGNKDQQRTYLLSESLLPDHLARLKSLVGDNPTQLRNVELLGELVSTRMAQLRTTLDGYEADGLPGAQRAVLPQSLITQKELRAQIDAMVSFEQQLLETRIEATGRSANRLLIGAIAGIPIGLAMVLLVYLFLSRELKRRVEAKQESAKNALQLESAIVELQSTSDDLALISEFSGYLQNCSSIEEALKVAMNLFQRLLVDSAGGIFLAKASQNYFGLRISWAPAAYPQPSLIYPHDCWSVRRGKAHISSQGSASPCCEHADAQVLGTDVIVCLPLASPGHQLGLITVKASRRHVESKHRLLIAAAEQLSLSVSSLELRETLRYHSTRDELTGLYNRRYLNDALPQLHARSVRHEKPYAVLMLDIDHFKQFNDAHGHAGGDRVLQEVAQVLKSLRAEDIACRFGGEEILVALPETDTAGALLVAERIRGEIQTLRTEVNGVTMPAVTVSIGVAAFPANGTEAQRVRLNADLALYRAKREGRNRVLAFDASVDQT